MRGWLLVCTVCDRINWYLSYMIAFSGFNSLDFAKVATKVVSFHLCVLDCGGKIHYPMMSKYPGIMVWNIRWTYLNYMIISLWLDFLHIQVFLSVGWAHWTCPDWKWIFYCYDSGLIWCLKSFLLARFVLYSILVCPHLNCCSNRGVGDARETVSGGLIMKSVLF